MNAKHNVWNLISRASGNDNGIKQDWSNQSLSSITTVWVKNYRCTSKHTCNN